MKFDESGINYSTDIYSVIKMQFFILLTAWYFTERASASSSEKSATPTLTGL